MSRFVPFDRDQPFLLPPDLKDWVPDDDLAHFVVAAVERVPMSAFKVKTHAAGKPQYHPQMMLALLIYCYAHGLFSSRRIERASYRDLGVRFVAANNHPDHDTVATFRRENRAAFEAAFLQVLLLAKESGLLQLGTVSVDGTKIDADAAKVRSVRYDRIQALRAKLVQDIAALTEQAEAADRAETDDAALPEELSRRQTLLAKLDAAQARLEADAAAQAEAERPDYQARKAAWDRRKGRKGRPPRPPEDGPPPQRQINLTDPDSRLMRRSDAHEYRQAYNAQAAVDAEGSQLVVGHDVLTSPHDSHGLVALIGTIAPELGQAKTVLGDAGYGSAAAIEGVEALGLQALIAPRRTQPHRPYDFRPPPAEPPGRPERQVTAPWRQRMRATLDTEAGRRLYARRKRTVEPVFGIIKHCLGFRRFHLRGLEKVKTEWLLTVLAYNCKRTAKLLPA